MSPAPLHSQLFLTTKPGAITFSPDGCVTIPSVTYHGLQFDKVTIQLLSGQAFFWNNKTIVHKLALRASLLPITTTPPTLDEPS